MYRIIVFLIGIINSSPSFSQFNIKGKVASEQGEAIEFASVFLEGTNHATISDAAGNFNLENIPAGDFVLKATFLGFQPYLDSITVNSSMEIGVVLGGVIYQLDQIEIINNRVDQEDAFTYTDVSKEEINAWNNGQDMPYILRFNPSTVVTSDAGTGVGYTGVRIRGTDATRINVTINGIPLNDSESQGVFWVNMPDFATITDNIQIQRGVGASTVGVGAFGGSISLNTFKTKLNPSISAKLGIGSFGTRRMNIGLGSGLINDKYSVDFHYAAIKSDGYVDRGTADLNSIYFNAARVSENSSSRLMVFSGSEVTYQSWWGVPESKVNGDNTGLRNHYNNNIGAIYFNAADSLNLFNSDRKYNYYRYENQVDDYGQTHVQFHDFRKLDEQWSTSIALNYTHGKGFFEEYKVRENLEDYDLSPGESDLIRRRWLDNDFFGGNLGLNYHSDSFDLEMGGSYFKYIGDHFGRVVDVIDGSDFDRSATYYYNRGNKTDLSSFAKANYSINTKVSLYGDLQVRRIEYTNQGDDNDGVDINIDETFNFLNPKAGIYFKLDEQQSLYTSYSIANKEPSRSDFVDRLTVDKPKSERLYDLEIGYKYLVPKTQLEFTLYNMSYDDQLVLNGALNDVGSPLRTNVDRSYRRGIEVVLSQQLSNQFSIATNATYSQNRIENFTEILYDYTDGFEIIENQFENVDIAFSPSFLWTGILGYKPKSDVEIVLAHQYIGRQFLDNTGDVNRMLDAYTVGDLKVTYSPEMAFTKNIRIVGEIRNIWNAHYASNGYTYSYVFGGLITENFLYPQAGRNFMLSLNADF